ncbi:MAG: hypothetical protein EPO51_25860 [Phenylobacterium sp.]|uniref:hypothetical protein n=1 Tax=Phenylobacterium sp. TaxID=1871053 RepID=UPI001227365F|nr:hypothetical protein [Phenylobacterium sp.]TAJ68952.1 MAG: hypothetical protein EPO51_25860 [Phenylobacterium sp.]
MNKLIVASLASAGLMLAACTKAEQAKTDQNVDQAASDVSRSAAEVGDKVSEAAKDVANSPAVEKAGDSLKEAAKDTGTILKEAGKGAVSGAKEGMAKAEGKDAEEKH